MRIERALCIFIVVCLFAVASVAVARAGDAEAQPKPFSAAKDLAPLKSAMEEHSDLKDPFSVQFRKVQVREPGAGGFAKIWCGQLNAKNSMGGYVGWADFTVIEKTDAAPSIYVVSDSGIGKMNAVMVDAFCKGSTIRPVATKS